MDESTYTHLGFCVFPPNAPHTLTPLSGRQRIQEILLATYEWEVLLWRNSSNPVTSLRIRLLETAALKASSKQVSVGVSCQPSEPKRLLRSDYYVYENYNFDMVRLHRGTCRCCNYGRGLKGRGSTNTGRWIPAETLEAAIRLALSLDRFDVAACKRCLRGVTIEDAE